jgi:hypothetical protein
LLLPQTQEVKLPTFAAYVEFRFDANDLEATSQRLRELMHAADVVGFAFQRSRVEEVPLNEDGADHWTGYGPTIDVE